MSNIITGSDFHELIIGTDADDTIISLSGYDTLDGGEGSDTYVVNAGDYNSRFVDFYNDTGLTGLDIILAAEAGIEIGLGSGFGPESGIETIDGLEDSSIVGDDAAQIWDFSETTVTGVSGIFGFGGADNITGTSLADVIDGGEGHDTLNGGNGRDTLNGGEGHDIILGGSGSDSLTGGAGFDILDGGEGGDRYFVGLENAGFVDTYQDSGTSGTDRILATEDGTVIGLINGFGPESGIERIQSAGNQDVTIGGTDGSEIWDFSQTQLNGIRWINALDGHDIVTGNAQNNRIDAGAGHDIVNGGAGRDYILGNDGNDTLNGGDGNDRLEGGAGFDILDGGNGDDLYYFNTASNGSIDIIQDTGTSTRDRIVATEDNVEIGLQSDFSSANGIEVITSIRHENVTIEGSNDGVNWDFSDVRLNGIAEINGGEGRDIIRGSSRSDTINGGAGHDQLYGGTGRDVLNGGADSDFLYGEIGRDTLNGGAGNDILNGGKAKDILTGGEGFDIFEFDQDSYHDTITDFTVGEDLIDLTSYEEITNYDDISFEQTDTGLKVFFGVSSVLLENIFTDSLAPESFIGLVVETPVIEEPVDAPVILNAGNESATLEGGSGNDILNGLHGDDTLIGFAGDDELNGGNANDHLEGGSGNDTLIGSHGNDTIFGDEGDDLLDGGNNNDTLNGGAGDDILIGFNGVDVLIGGDGHDILDGGNDNDILEGGDGHDQLDGFNGRDILDGGAGNDILVGYNDADILTGGTGHDILTGGYGADQFIFSEGDGHDIITDFERFGDNIDFTSFNGEISFEDLVISSTENGTLVHYGVDSILLEGIEIDVVTEDFFTF